MTEYIWPKIKPFNHFFIERQNHRIYVEECGNPKGIPIIFLHGGPGAGCNDLHRQLFDPKKYHAILFDQRGCGRSTPAASIENNTPQNILADIEAIRKYLNIESWHLFGGSWGSTLALLYAIQQPDTVRSMILRGIFLGGKSEIDWIYEPDGCANFFSQHYQTLVSGLQPAKGIVNQYYDKLKTNSASQYAHRWATWEAINSAINVTDETLNTYLEPKLALSLSRISTHFFVNELFLDKNYILDHLNKITHIKTFIVQGRYDLLCPPKTAELLAQKLNNATLHIIDNAGHSLFEKDILDKVLIYLNNDIET